MHWVRAGGRGARVGTTAALNADANEQWPYKFKLTGTAPDNSIIHLVWILADAAGVLARRPDGTKTRA